MWPSDQFLFVVFFCPSYLSVPLLFIFLVVNKKAHLPMHIKGKRKETNQLPASSLGRRQITLLLVLGQDLVQQVPDRLEHLLAAHVR